MDDFGLIPLNSFLAMTEYTEDSAIQLSSRGKIPPIAMLGNRRYLHRDDVAEWVTAKFDAVRSKRNAAQTAASKGELS